MKKVLFFDVETTGLDSKQNDIVQLAGCIECDGQLQEEFNFKMQPFDFNNISAEALKINNLTIEELQTFDLPTVIHRQFVNVLSLYVNKFDRDDKMYIAGYNVTFDINFLAEWFKKCNDQYLGSWINWKKIDPFQLMHLADFAGSIDLPNYKLETVCNYLGIEIDAHDALSDIRATRELINLLLPKITPYLQF